MKFRNEILLAVSFFLGLYFSSLPQDISDAAQQAELRPRATSTVLAQVTPNARLLIRR